MQNIQSKAKSFILVGLFIFLFLGLSFSSPSSAAAAVEPVSTQITYQPQQIVNSDMAYHAEVTSHANLNVEAPEVDSVQLEVVESDDDWSWKSWFWWLVKTTKNFVTAKSLAWSG